MYFCEICNKKADIHHIVHKSEGGFDIELNYMYLCEEHHRGKLGPHHCLKTDISYKINLQKKLYKEGYKKEDVIFILMGKAYYSEELLENIELEKLYESIHC